MEKDAKNVPTFVKNFTFIIIACFLVINASATVAVEQARCECERKK